MSCEPAAWGEPRHPSFALTLHGKFHVSTSDVLIRRCSGGEVVSYRADVRLDDAPDALLDADRTGAPVDVIAYGTREGDTGNWQATVEDVRAAESSGVLVSVRLPNGEQGVLHRWAKTGCLLCGDGDE